MSTVDMVVCADSLQMRPSRRDKLKRLVRKLLCTGPPRNDMALLKPNAAGGGGGGQSTTAAANTVSGGRGQADATPKPTITSILTRIPTRYPNSNDGLDRLCRQEDPRQLYAASPLQKIGQGRSGAVYRVPGRRLAIKEVKVPMRPDLRKSLLNEITALVSLAASSPKGVMRLDDVFMFNSGADKKIWMVCEEGQYGNLTGIITRLKLTEPQMSVVMRQLLAALGHIHAGGWLHRDIKSDNVFVAEEGRIIVGDFGACARADDRSGTRLSGTTPHWMSPEDIRSVGGESVPAGDIWAAGIVLHEMVVGEPPFWHCEHDEAMQRIASVRTSLDLRGLRGSQYLKDFMARLLCVKEQRMSAEQALQHPFITIYSDQPESIIMSAVEKLKRTLVT